MSEHVWDCVYMYMCMWEERGWGGLTLNVLYHTIPHELCGCEGKDVHGLQSFILTLSDESEQFAFHPPFARTNAFNICISKENSAIPLEEWVLVSQELKS